MSDVAYQTLANAVHSAGFYTNGIENLGSWQRTTVCSKRTPDGRLTGNSFWVTHVAGEWYLGAWGGQIYRLPNADQISELCITWMTRAPHETRWDFDDALKAEFKLQPLTEQEFDQVIGVT